MLSSEGAVAAEDVEMRCVQCDVDVLSISTIFSIFNIGLKVQRKFITHTHQLDYYRNKSSIDYVYH